jgi:hypothetical protein
MKIIESFERTCIWVSNSFKTIPPTIHRAITSGITPTDIKATRIFDRNFISKDILPALGAESLA